MRRTFLLLVMGFGMAGAAQSFAEVAPAASTNTLDVFQETLTSDEFSRLLNNLYTPAGGLEDYTLYGPASVKFFGDTARTGAPSFELRFAADAASRRSRPAAAFKDLAALAALKNPADQPMRGIRIAIDPGHIGGRWARMEERFFVGDRTGWFVQEAALNLEVAQKLKARLEAAGAEVRLTKDNFEPVTASRPEQFAEEARKIESAVIRFPDLQPQIRQADLEDRVGKRQEYLFYRREEIRARADRVNLEIKPDLTICLHFNAVELQPGETFTTNNAVVVFVHGSYLPEELSAQSARWRLLEKLLGGVHEVELPVARAVAESMAVATGLPASPSGGEGGGPARPIFADGLVCARNLAANRLMDGPVVFTEAYYMNNRTVFQRIQAGDYEGTREIDGRVCRSIFREYADAVADGLIKFYGAHAVGAPCTVAPAPVP